MLLGSHCSQNRGFRLFLRGPPRQLPLADERHHAGGHAEWGGVGGGESLQADHDVAASFGDNLSNVLAVLLQLLPVPLLGLFAWHLLLQRLVALWEDGEVHPPRAPGLRAPGAPLALRRLRPALQMLQDSGCLLVPLRPPSPPGQGPAAREAARRLASEPGSHRHDAAGPSAEQRRGGGGQGVVR